MQRKRCREMEQSVLVTAHSSADADALGCLAACSVLFPQCTVLWPGSFDASLNDLVKEEAHACISNFKTLKQMNKAETFETVVVVDTASQKKSSHAEHWIQKASKVVCIDHHPRGQNDLENVFARWCIRWGSATAVILALIVGKFDPFEVVEEQRVVDALKCFSSKPQDALPFSSKIASLMLCGIHQDTGSFRFSSTTPHDMLAAYILMSCSPDLNLVQQYLNACDKSQSSSLTPVQHEAFKQLKQSVQIHELKNGDSVAVAFAQDENDCPNFSSVVQLLFNEKGYSALFGIGAFGKSGLIIVCGRSLQSSVVDCSAVCSALGGGGHKGAAAVSLNGEEFTLNSARERIFSVLRDLLGPPVLVSSIMTRKVIGIPADCTVLQASQIMLERGLKKAPCFDRDGHPFGLLDKNSVDKAVKLNLHQHKAADFAQELPPSLSPSATLDQAVELLLRENCRMVLVREAAESAVLGVLSRSDVINQLIQDPFLKIPKKSSKERSVTVSLDGRAPPSVIRFLREAGYLADELGFELYVVGGFPRDVLLHRDNDDIDFVVAGGEACVFARELHKKFGHPKIPVLEHEKFHTAVVTLQNGDKVDVATARLEYYPMPASLPIVELSSLKMDLSRRDFTINALAMRLNKKHFGMLVDFFHSRNDIEMMNVSVLHTLSFVEDPTRMFRAVRFCCRYGFHLSHTTKRLLKNAVEQNVMAQLTGSRIFHEFEKIFAEQHPAPCIAMLHEHRLLQCVHPDMQSCFQMKDFEEGLQTVQWFTQLYPLEFDWKCLLLCMCWRMSSKSFHEVIVRLMVPKCKTGEMEESFALAHKACNDLKIWIHEKKPVSEMCKIFKTLSLETSLAVLTHLRVENLDWVTLSKFLTHWRFVAPSINGNDLKSLGIKPGPLYGVILAELLDAIIDGHVSMEKSEQMEYVRQRHLAEK